MFFDNIKNNTSALKKMYSKFSARNKPSKMVTQSPLPVSIIREINMIECSSLDQIDQNHLF